MKQTLLPIIPLTALIAALSGCSTHTAVVQPGDRVDVGFTCRLPNGEIAATTRPDSSVSTDRKSAYYLPRNGAEAVTITAGPLAVKDRKDRVSFEDEIMNRLGVTLVGLKEGDQAVRELQAERYPALSPADRFVSMALVRKRQKEMRLSHDEYTTRTGKTPEVGQRLVLDPLVPGTVSEVTDKEVVVRFAPDPAKPMVSPFGPMTVRETSTHYELEVKTEQGRLIRSGGMAGRVVEVTADSFKIDFGHPFGGEILTCDVDVASITPADLKISAPVVIETIPADVTPVPAAKTDTTLDPQAEKVFNEGMARMLAQSDKAPEASAAAVAGDLVTTNYTVTLEDGSLVATTRKEIALDQAVKKVTWYREPATYVPQELVAGKQEVMPGLGEALTGMKSGEKRRITLTPDKTFGQPDTQKLQQLSCSQGFPSTIRMPADEYVKRFAAFPTMNKEVELLPYFKSRVTEITESDVALEFLVEDGASFNDSFGSISVAVTGGNITMTTKPLIGAPFQFKDGTGIITATDGSTFTVDFNHPLAGKTIVLDLEAVSVSKASQGADVVWNDDYDAGLARAKQEGKPVFLILHADWCSWCKKTFTETIPDPRIQALKERFIWVRVNSDKKRKYKKQYAQEGFPMVVLLNSDGAVLKKIDGYRDARALREEIRAVLN